MVKLANVCQVYYFIIHMEYLKNPLLIHLVLLRLFFIIITSQMKMKILTIYYISYLHLRSGTRAGVARTEDGPVWTEA